jgi:hypothetical protein
MSRGGKEGDERLTTSACTLVVKRRGGEGRAERREVDSWTGAQVDSKGQVYEVEKRTAGMFMTTTRPAIKKRCTSV